MALGIAQNGIVFREDRGGTWILQPARNGGPATRIEVPPELADAHRLVTGDVVAGETEPIADEDLNDPADPEQEPALDWESRFEFPSVGSEIRSLSQAARRASKRLISVTRVNDLDPAEAADRPVARTKRSQSERTPPDRRLTLAEGPGDMTGRTLDFAAPLGAGEFGIVYGPHGAGLTRTLQTILNGIVKNAPDVVIFVLLLRSRAEEATEWRRFPNVEVVSASATFSNAPPEEALQMSSLVLEAAQRQTEMGRDVAVLIDSLTGLWGAMLEAEQADAQHEADSSSARSKIREWTQKAGCFHGAAPLGGGLGGSLTFIGSVWHQAIDEEAEEERDTHPHLRLLEHILQDASWQVALSGALKQRALYPAIDLKRCRSQYEERLLPAEIVEPLLTARGGLPAKKPVACHIRLTDALENSTDLPGLITRLTEINRVADRTGEKPKPVQDLQQRDTNRREAARAFFRVGALPETGTESEL